jgi:hypothetical protein
MKPPRRQFLRMSGLSLAASVVAPSFASAEAPAANDAWETMTRAARDAAYNNGAAVSDRNKILDGWASASATLRSKRSQHVDLAYSRGQPNYLPLKVYRHQRGERTTT